MSAEGPGDCGLAQTHLGPAPPPRTRSVGVLVGGSALTGLSMVVYGAVFGLLGLIARRGKPRWDARMAAGGVRTIDDSVKYAASRSGTRVSNIFLGLGAAIVVGGLATLVGAAVR